MDRAWMGGTIRGLYLLMAAALGCAAACQPAPLEVPVEPWTRAWPTGELPGGMVACLVIQQPRAFFERAGPGLERLGLRPGAAALDPSRRGLTLVSGAVWLEPERFDVPMVMAFEIQDPAAIEAWQRGLRDPLAAVGATTVWGPKGFDADAVFRHGAEAIPDRPNPFLFMRLTDRRLVSGFDPVSVGLALPYLLGQPGELGTGPSARLRLRPDRLHRSWASLFPDRAGFFAAGAAELKARLGTSKPAWLPAALDDAARLAAQLRWIELDLGFTAGGPRIVAWLAFEPGSPLAKWKSSHRSGPVDLEAACAGLGLDRRTCAAAREAGVRVARRRAHLEVGLPVGAEASEGP